MFCTCSKPSYDLCDFCHREAQAERDACSPLPPMGLCGSRHTPLEPCSVCDEIALGQEELGDDLPELEPCSEEEPCSLCRWIDSLHSPD